VAQLFFNFLLNSKDKIFNEENFVILEENLAAIGFLKNFFAQKRFTTAQIPSLILKGERLSGKSHLLHIFAKKFGAEFLDKNHLKTNNLFNSLSENKFYILENIEDFSDEELLLGLINSAVESKSFLLFSTKPKTKFTLKDLDSRIKNIFTTEIKNPNLEAIKQILISEFSRRQINAPKRIIDLIANNIERSYLGISNAVKLVEFHTHESGKNITSAEIKKLLKI
jgi:chromosomal replication initiation ATPase DnaA